MSAVVLAVALAVAADALAAVAFVVAVVALRAAPGRHRGSYSGGER